MAKSSPYQPPHDHHAVDAKSPVLSVSQMLAAGLASVGAAVFTSRFGVAGTVLGAALTTMIITGGSAILKSYLETIAGHAKSVPQRMGAGRSRRNRMRAGRGRTVVVDRDLPEPPPGMAVYGRGGDQGLLGRIRSSFGWFSRLSSSRKAGVLLGAFVPAVVVFVVAMSAITSVELFSGRTLSCLTGGTCQQTVNADGTTSSSTTFGEIASGARSSGGSSQPFSEQLAEPNLAPDQSGQPDASGGGSGFFGQPDGSQTPSGSGGAVEEVPSGSGGSEQPVTPTAPAEEVPTDDGSAVDGSGSAGELQQVQPSESGVQ